MSNEQQDNNGQLYHINGCKFHDYTQQLVVNELRGLREDFKGIFEDVLKKATAKGDEKMIPIKSHYMILVGSLILLLGVETVKEFWGK